MIQSLHIHHIALIEDLTIRFQRGMHVLTGETGAGKSIVVDAVNLVLGGRADRDLIRTGTDRAWVEAVFETDTQPELAALFVAQELEFDGSVTLYRELARSGRSLCRVNGLVMPLSFLRQVSALLMDVHGQHEHQFLMDSAFHLRFLDEAGDAAHQALLADTAAACEAFLACHRRYSRLVREAEQRAFRMEQLHKSLSELEKARLRPGEEESLTQERARNQHWQKLSTALREAYGALSAGEAFSALPLVKTALDALNRASQVDDTYRPQAERLAAAYYELEETGYELAGILEKGEFDPARAEAIENRLDLIHRLERRYGASIPDVLAAQAEMQRELDSLSEAESSLHDLAREDKRLLGAYRAAAGALTASRQQLALVFEQRMMDQLTDLGMEKTVFSVALTPRGGGKPAMPQPEGDDLAEFMISPNPGEPLKPLSRIASGGELSRLMLALKTLEADRGGVGCMVFDEIDTGISGRMAQVVAEKMALIAAAHQVICVTHLPQIAAMAAHEYLVEKSVTEGRTSTAVRLLSPEERVGEVARMLGGADGSGTSARSHAAHMLEMAGEYRDKLENRTAAGL